MELYLTVLSCAGIAGCALWLIVFLRKKPRKSTVFCVFLALAAFTANAAIQLHTLSAAGGAAAVSSSSQQKTQSSGTPYQADLIGGYYTPGIDFPAGSYSITVLRGSGSIYCTDPSSGGKKYEVTAGKTSLPKTIELPIGEVLSVSGVKIHLESSSTEPGELSGRENSATKEVTLSPGSYVAGKDFSEGIYNVVALRGKGLVASDSIASGIRSELDAAGADYQKEFNNLILDEATRLTVTGVSVKLVPSK
ncbi:MAG: hypothetical protein GX424_09730 [Clostridiales bacterium]|nr:hypothetical protein [Clostridiales bacterium]